MKLDRRLQIYRAALTDDGYERAEVFAAFGPSLPCNRFDVTTRERMLAEQVQADIKTRFTIRSSEFARGLDPRDKLECEGEFFDITGIRQVERKRWLEITASARADLDTLPTGGYSDVSGGASS